LREICADPTFVIQLDNRHLKLELEILVAKTTLSGNLNYTLR